MKIDEILKTDLDLFKQLDIERALYILDKIPSEFGRACYINPSYDLWDSVDKSISKFEIYKSNSLIELLKTKAEKKISYSEKEETPLNFDVEFASDSDGNLMPIVTHPRILDDTSYVFLGHEFHHILKDVNKEEKKLEKRMGDVIPMFYELVSAKKEEDSTVKKEILKRRMLLLTLNKKYYEADIENKIQYFNSFYYSLCLYNKYKNNPVLVLRLVTRVLMGEITTLDLLNILDIYDSSLDTVVDDEIYNIKEYIHS